MNPEIYNKLNKEERDHLRRDCYKDIWILQKQYSNIFTDTEYMQLSAIAKRLWNKVNKI
jgi:hypothetical protein